MVARFWRWYQRNYLATLVLTTAVFLLQLFHLYWLFSAVILERLTGQSHFVFPPAGMVVYVVADYLEVPALVSATLLYAFELRKGMRVRPLLFLLLLNSQWVHLLWLTDEVVVDTLTQHSLLHWSAAAAWVAILIDYLEVPVIVDTLVKVARQRGAIWAHVRRRFAPPAPAATPRTGSWSARAADAGLAGD